MKKLVSVLLVLAMATACLAGCGGKDNAGKADGGNAEKKDAFYIGGIGPITGDYAIYGNAVKNGAQIAIDEINAAGGINGAQIEYQFQDDQGDIEKAGNAYNTLKDWGMNLSMGTVTSDPCVAVSNAAAKDNMFLLTPSASSAEVVEPDNAFQVCFTDPNQGYASARYIGENGLAKKVAIIYESSTTYSTGITDTFVKEAENQPFEIVAKEAFTTESNTDFQTQLQIAKDAGAELIFLPIYYQQASIILKQADTMGLDVKFFGCDGMDGILALENFDTSLAEGLMLLTPFAATAQDEATVSFVTKYKDAYGEEPNQFAADAYDVIYAMKAAAEKANVKPDMSVSDICDAMKAAMTEINISGLTAGDGGLSWEASGLVTKAPLAVVIENGVYQMME